MGKEITNPKFFESAWDRIVFIGSIIGLLFLVFISIYRNHQLKESVREYESIQKYQK